jgi:catechol 2,3-dioxygenase-like lactoylglutathione lyase family enzyme
MASIISGKKVAFIQYPVSDIARSRAFYGKTLGLTLEYQNERSQWKGLIDIQTEENLRVSSLH